MSAANLEKPEKPELPEKVESRMAPGLAAAGVVAAVSAFVGLLVTLDVHRNTGLARADWRVLRRIQYHSSSLLVDGAQTVVQFGNVETLLVIAVVAGLLLRWRGLRPMLSVVPLASLLVAGAFVQIGKSSIERAAPHEWRFDPSGLGSFPSGHSADTMSVCIGIAIVLAAVLVRRPAERVAVFAVALGVSIAVGVSTLVLGVHWPTDVVAGWAIGLGAAVLVGSVAVFATRERPFAT